MSVLLLLSLCVITVIQLTSSQSTYDVIQQDNDVNSCERTEHFEDTVLTALSQLQKDVAELKAAVGQLVAKGELTLRILHWVPQHQRAA